MVAEKLQERAWSNDLRYFSASAWAFCRNCIYSHWLVIGFHHSNNMQRIHILLISDSAVIIASHPILIATHLPYVVIQSGHDLDKRLMPAIYHKYTIFKFLQPSISWIVRNVPLDTVFSCSVISLGDVLKISSKITARIYALQAGLPSVIPCHNSLSWGIEFHHQFILNFCGLFVFSLSPKLQMYYIHLWNSHLQSNHLLGFSLSIEPEVQWFHGIKPTMSLTTLSAQHCGDYTMCITWSRLRLWGTELKIWPIFDQSNDQEHSSLYPFLPCYNPDSSISMVDRISGFSGPFPVC